MSGLILRTVKPGDLEAVYIIERLSFKHPFPPSYLETMAYLSPETFLVALLERRLVGYSASVIRGSEGHVVSIAVHPDYRRMGVGERLLKETVKNLKRLGVSRVVLEVRVDNEPAVSLYRKMGFKISELLRGYYWNGEDAYRMVLDLKQRKPFNFP